MQKAPACPSCSHAFSLKEGGRNHPSRQPLLLHCGHTYCETCLNTLARLNKLGYIECPACGKQTILKDGVKSLWPDTYMMGLLSQIKKPTLNLKSFTFVLANAAKQKNEIVNQQTEIKVICSECNLNQATCKCLKCECNMCGLCFDKIHTVSKTLRKHQAVPLEDERHSRSSACSEHSRPIEYFCEDDQIAICSHCVIMGNHKQHSISSLEDKNKLAISEIEPAMSQTNLVYRKLKKSEKVLNDISPVVKKEYTQKVSEIQAHFRKLHTSLQVREMVLIEQLEEAFRKEVLPVEKMKSEIQEEREKLDLLIADAQRLMNNNNHLILNAQEVLSKLKVVPEIPCHITKITENIINIQCQLEEDECTEQMTSWGSISGQSAEDRFLLKPLSELSIEELAEDASDTADEATSATPASTPDIIVDDDNGSDAYCDIPSSRGTSEMTLSRPSSEVNGPVDRLAQRTRVSLVRQEMVYVTHIRHPCDFVVQRCSDADRLKNLAQSMNKWANSTASNTSIPSTLNPDDMVLAKYSLDENWYRARVRSIIKQDSSGEQKIEIFYMDYGNTEIVSIDRLRKMQKKFLRLADLAVKCSLNDIVPATETGEWSQQAILAFAKMTADKPMQLTVLKNVDGVMIVDLSKPANEEIEDDRPVSVRDALVFLELACFVSPQSVVKPGGYAPKPNRQFLSPELPYMNEERDAHVSHIESPHSFYIQMIGEEALALTSIMDELDKLYSVDDKDMRAVFCPQKDMICVAMYEDKRWYRAQVVELPGRKQVMVKYVDFGNTELVSYLLLRKILDEFVRLPTQAVHCKLADIEPVDKKNGWTFEAKKWFSKHLIYKHVLVKVTDIVDRTLSIVLYNISDKQEICINAQMVKYGYAVSTGLNSSFHPSVSPVKPVATPIYAAADSTTQEEFSSLVGGIDSGISLTSQSNSSETEAVTQPPEKCIIDEPAYYQIQVIRVESPGCFYVQLASALEDGLGKLNEELMESFKDSEASNIAWKEGNDCVAQYSVDKKWYRARITGLSDDTVQVLLVDYGYVDSLSVDKLRPLGKFNTDPAFALRCHLVDIQAAGDKKKWSNTACEFLTEEVADKNCYIKIYDYNVNESLPVDLLVEEHIKGDALTADKVEYNSVAKKILDNGLALPIRRKKKQISEEQETAPPVGTSLVSHDPLQESPAVVPVTQEPVPPDVEVSVRTEVPETDQIPVVSSTASSQSKLRRSPSSAAPDDGRPAQFLPPDLPTSEFLVAVPTYVDYDGVIHVQEVKNEESPEGHFGYILKENTLEVQLQNKYFGRRGKHRYNIPRDGNCLFSCFAKAVLDNEERHEDVRACLVRELNTSWELFENTFAGISKETCLKEIATSGTYGGEPEIQLLCWAYHVQATVYCGGLLYDIQVRKYGDENDPEIQLTYVSDGQYDSGHYDLVLNGVESEPNHVYDKWREARVKELKEYMESGDATTYDDSLLQQLMDHLQQTYKDTEPEPEDTTWQLGQAVVSRFSQDELWHRGTITHIDEKGIRVFYIDFGNSEYVTPDRLRHNPILTELPQQSLQCVLHNLIPVSETGVWPVEVLEYIHNNCVEKICSLQIKEIPVYGEPLQVHLHLPSGPEIGDWVHQTGLAMYRGEEPPAVQSDVLIEGEQKGALSEENYLQPAIDFVQLQSQVENPFRKSEPHSLGDRFLVEITHIEQPDLLYMQHVQIENTDDPDTLHRNQELEDLMQISAELNATEFTTIQDPKPGMACIGKYTADDGFYRTQILDILKDESGKLTHAVVIYVDYGTPDIVTTDRLYEIPEKFTTLPPQALFCRVSGLSLPVHNNRWTLESVNEMTACVSGKNLLACVTDLEPMLAVELYEPESGEPGKLAYQSLLDSGKAHYATTNWGDS